ncbi:hypothetical protein D3C81_1089800 [compost metagenome]
MQINIFISPGSSLNRALRLGESWRIQNDNIPGTSTSCRHRYRSIGFTFRGLGTNLTFIYAFDLFTEIIESVGNNEFDTFSEAVQFHISFGALNRMGRDIQTSDFLRTVFARMKGEASRMGKAFQHRRSIPVWKRDFLAFSVEWNQLGLTGIPCNLLKSYSTAGTPARHQRFN